MTDEKIELGAGSKLRSEMLQCSAILFEGDMLKTIVKNGGDNGIKLLKVIKSLLPNEIKVDEVISKVHKSRIKEIVNDLKLTEVKEQGKMRYRSQIPAKEEE